MSISKSISLCISLHICIFIPMDYTYVHIHVYIHKIHVYMDSPSWASSLEMSRPLCLDALHGSEEFALEAWDQPEGWAVLGSEACAGGYNTM